MSIRVPDTKDTKASVYKEAGDARYAEAKALENQYPSGAIYLAGYLVECYLKWALCLRNGVQRIKELQDKSLADLITSAKGHDLELLCEIAKYDKHYENNAEIKIAFMKAAEWNPNIRYLGKCAEYHDAVQFMAAVRKLKDDISSWAYQ
ncbi:MAG: hypothetical protein NTX50_00765 [Candidatus Sumerlaeota bacterium]|nr:hypothetical protein [Candidatus Sumerlaeota bacterium]